MRRGTVHERLAPGHDRAAIRLPGDRSLPVDFPVHLDAGQFDEQVDRHHQRPNEDR
ncbi:hypothetical protein D3C71_1894970 [compost metagenome]